MRFRVFKVGEQQRQRVLRVSEADVPCARQGRGERPVVAVHGQRRHTVNPDVGQGAPCRSLPCGVFMRRYGQYALA